MPQSVDAERVSREGGVVVEKIILLWENCQIVGTEREFYMKANRTEKVFKVR